MSHDPEQMDSTSADLGAQPPSTPDVQPTSDQVDVEKMADSALENAQKAAEQLRRATGSTPAEARQPEASATEAGLELPDLQPQQSGSTATIGMLDDVNLDVRIEMGRTRMLIEDVLKLKPDSVVELEKAAGDPVDVFVNGRLIARGEVLVLNDNFCVRINEVIEQETSLEG